MALADIAPGGNFYPYQDGGAGASLGIRMSGQSNFPGSPVNESEAEAPGMGTAMTLGNQQSVLIAGLLIIALLILLRFVAHHVGEDGDFKSIRVTFYNALVIGLSAVITIPLFKWLASKQPIGALKNYVMAA